MRIPSLPTLGLVLLLLSLAACSAPAALPAATSTPMPAPSGTGGRTIVISEVSDEPVKKIERFQPLADYLGAQLADFGIEGGEVRIVPDLQTAGELLKAGEVDIYFDSPYPAMMVTDLSGAHPLLRRWKEGQAEYHSVIFTRADSGVTELADLKGKLLALEENFSTSGYLLPAAHLTEAGLKLTWESDAAASIPPDEVGFAFTTDDENTVQWVLSGKAAAGAVDHHLFAELPPESLEGLVVLAETETVARHVVLVRPGMDPELEAAIKRALLALETTPDGQAILTAFEETARFDEFPSTEVLNRMRALYELVRPLAPE